MPYARRRRSFPRRRRSTRKTSRASASKKYVKAVVKRATQADPHHIDVAISDTSVAAFNAVPYVHPLVITQVGDTQQSRTGKMIQVTGFSIRGSLYRNPASTSHDRVRLVLVKIKNAAAYSAPTIYSALYDVDGATVSTAIQAYRRLDGGLMPNFQILYDRVVDLGYQATDKSTYEFRISRRFKRPIRCWYNDDGLVPPYTNDLRLVAISDTTANNPLLATSSRTWFLA